MQQIQYFVAFKISHNKGILSIPYSSFKELCPPFLSKDLILE